VRHAKPAALDPSSSMHLLCLHAFASNLALSTITIVSLDCHAGGWACSETRLLQYAPLGIQACKQSKHMPTINEQDHKSSSRWSESIWNFL